MGMVQAAGSAAGWRNLGNLELFEDFKIALTYNTYHPQMELLMENLETSLSRREVK